MKTQVSKFLRDEEGASAIEYGMIVGLIAVVLIVAITTTGLGDTLGGFFTSISDSLGGGS